MPSAVPYSFLWFFSMFCFQSFQHLFVSSYSDCSPFWRRSERGDVVLYLLLTLTCARYFFTSVITLNCQYFWICREESPSPTAWESPTSVGLHVALQSRYTCFVAHAGKVSRAQPWPVCELVAISPFLSCWYSASTCSVMEASFQTERETPHQLQTIMAVLVFWPEAALGTGRRTSWVGPGRGGELSGGRFSLVTEESRRPSPFCWMLSWLCVTPGLTAATVQPWLEMSYTVKMTKKRRRKAPAFTMLLLSPKLTLPGCARPPDILPCE